MTILTSPLKEADTQHQPQVFAALSLLSENDLHEAMDIAMAICQVPYAFISVIDTDRQVCLTCTGALVIETPFTNSYFAQLVLLPQEALTVENLLTDARFSTSFLTDINPLAVSFAGVALQNSAGQVWGVLGVANKEPTTYAAHQLTALQALARQLSKQREMKQHMTQLHTREKALLQANEQLDTFASMISHDLKAPLNNMTGLLKTLQDQHQKPEAGQLIKLLHDSAERLKNMVTAVLEYSKVTELTPQLSCSFALSTMIAEVVELLSPPENIAIKYASDLPEITTSRAALQQIFLNLFSNAIQYNDKTQGVIEVHFTDSPTCYEFVIKDNGRGIPATHQKRVFRLFQTFRKSRTESVGTGIGLSTVKKLVEKLGGEVEISSQPGIGATFSFSIQKKTFSIN